MTRKKVMYTIGVVYLLVSVLFIILLYISELIPNRLFLLTAGIIVLIYIGTVLLLTKIKSRGVKMVAYLFTIAMICCYSVGAFYVIQGINTLKEITQISVKHTDVGIYVKADNEAAQWDELSGYTFGILESIDRENTDKSVEELQQTFGKKFHIRTYRDLGELADSLLVSEETDAIILNTAFVDLYSDMEGYENLTDRIREFHVQQVEEIVEIVEEIPGGMEVAEAEESTAHIFNIFISGIDSRKGLVSRSRSDVNILATVNTDTRQIFLVSTPRDYFVPLSISNGVPDKLTHAGIYGIDVCVDTMEMLYDTEIEYYFRVNFSGFEQIVDALGGISVESDHDFTAYIDLGEYREFSYVKGQNHLNGAAALVFAHERYAFADGDRQRGRNQMKVIEGVINKAMSPVLLTNYSQIMESVAGCFETNVPYEVIADIVKDQLNTGGSWEITSYSVSGTGSSQRPYSLSTNAYVMLPDYSTVQEAAEKMKQIERGCENEFEDYQ